MKEILGWSVEDFIVCGTENEAEVNIIERELSSQRNIENKKNQFKNVELTFPWSSTLNCSRTFVSSEKEKTKYFLAPN